MKEANVQALIVKVEYLIEILTSMLFLTYM